MAYPSLTPRRPRYAINDPNNAFGSRIGRIGEMPNAFSNLPMRPPHNPYSSSAATRASNPLDQHQLWRAHQPMIQSASQGLPSYSSPSGFTHTGRPAFAKINSRPWSMPSMLNGRVVPDDQKRSIAMKRAQAGASLDEQSLAMLAGMGGGQQAGMIPVSAPNMGAIGPALGGQMDPRREAVVARAQAKAADRDMRLALRKGTPPAVAMLNRSGQGSPIHDALLYGSENASRLEGQRGTNQANLAVAAMENAAKGKPMSPEQAAAVSVMSSMIEADPSNASAVMGAMGGVFGQGGQAGQGVDWGALTGAIKPSVPTGFQPSEADLAAGMSADDAFAMISRSGDDDAIKDYARQNKWPSWKLNKALEEYGQGYFGQAKDAAMGLANPTPLVGPPALVGPPSNRRPPTKPLQKEIPRNPFNFFYPTR